MEQSKGLVVVEQWNLVSRGRDDDGAYVRLRVERYADGTGNVYRARVGGGEDRLFVEGTYFEDEPCLYVADPGYVIV